MVSETTKAWVGSLLFLLVAPGVVVVLVPWLISGWRGVDWGAAGWIAVPVSVILIVIGAVFLVHSFGRFAAQGVGTPAPIAPTRHLVVTGVYRYVRNPMYLSIVVILIGQALLLGNGWLALYALLAVLVTEGFVHFHEEPTLRRRFGEEYERYRAEVPGWWPRRTPYLALESK